MAPRTGHPRSHALAPSPRRENAGAGEWPLRSFLELGPLPGAVPCARLHTRQVLWEWGLTEVSENIELLVSELVTNAVNASRTMGEISPVALWLLSDHTRVVVLVRDGNPRSPVRVDAGEEAGNGRGLVLVEAISDHWDWYVPRGGGKVVRAVVTK